MELIPKSEELDIVNHLLRILKTFNTLTDIFDSSEHGMAAMVGPRAVGLLRDLRNQLIQVSDLPDESFDVLSSFRYQLTAELKSRIELSAMATVLHPTYNSLWIIPEEGFRSSVLSRL